MPPLAPWTPFVREEARLIKEENARAVVAAHGGSHEEAKAVFEEAMKDEIWVNSRYQVSLRRMTYDAPDVLEMVRLSIRRRDKAPLGRERLHDFQRIKNELVGPECEGFETYPAESRLANSESQYHVFVVNDPAFRLPWSLSKWAAVGGAARQHCGGHDGTGQVQALADG